MRFLLGLCVLFTLPLGAATQVTARIHDIDHGDHITDEALVFLSSGKVMKINVQHTGLLNRLNDSLQRQDLVKLDVDDRREILRVAVERKEKRSIPRVTPQKELLSPDPLEGYKASVLTEDFAKQIFKEARHASKEETQCFNRALIWGYEWRVKHNVYSKKVWIYFTRKYIRRYNFEWWFHVSPMIDMIVDGQVKERVMDRKYSNGPRAIQSWANIFLRDDARCPTVHRYSDHSNYPEAGSCFIQKSPMYYYQPVDLEYLDKFGSVKNRWVENEVRMAYAEAFDIYP